MRKYGKGKNAPNPLICKEKKCPAHERNTIKNPFKMILMWKQFYLSSWFSSHAFRTAFLRILEKTVNILLLPDSGGMPCLRFLRTPGAGIWTDPATPGPAPKPPTGLGSGAVGICLDKRGGRRKQWEGGKWGKIQIHNNIHDAILFFSWGTGLQRAEQSWEGSQGWGCQELWSLLESEPGHDAGTYIYCFLSLLGLMS